MRSSIVALVILAALWTSSCARTISFNLSETSKCAETQGCDFFDKSIWDDELVPESGDDITVAAQQNINLFITAAELTDFNITAHYTSLTISNSSIGFSTLTLRDTSALVISTNTAIMVNESVMVFASSISVEKESQLELNENAHTFTIDQKGVVTVHDTSFLTSYAWNYIFGQLASTDAATIHFYGNTEFHGTTLLESSEMLLLSKATFYANFSSFPHGFEADHVDVLEGAQVNVSVALIIQGSLTLANETLFIVNQAVDAEILSGTNQGAISGNGTLHLISSSTIIAPPAAHEDGNWTDFEGNIIITGHNSLLLSKYTLKNLYFDASADLILNVSAVSIVAPMENFIGEINAYWFSDYQESLTVEYPINLTRCITSRGGSMSFDGSVTCGVNYAFIAMADDAGHRPDINLIGNENEGELTTLTAAEVMISQASLQPSYATIQSANQFVSNNVTLYLVNSIIVAGSIVWGNTTVTLHGNSVVQFGSGLSITNTSEVVVQGTSAVSNVGTANVALSADSLLMLQSTSFFQNNDGYTEFDGSVILSDASSITLGNVAFRGNKSFDTTGGISFLGSVLWSGPVVFSRGVVFSAPLVLTPGTILEVHQSLTASGPVYLEAGSELHLVNCSATFKSNDTYPAIWGAGHLFVNTSYVDTDAAVAGKYFYSDFQGPVTIGGASTLSLLLFSFNEVDFATGVSGEPANVLLEAYGVRFNRITNWAGPIVMYLAVEDYPSLEVYAPSEATSITSNSASLNLTSTLTSLYGPVSFLDTEKGYTGVLYTSNNSELHASKGLYLEAAHIQVGSGTSHIFADVFSMAGSIIFVGDGHNLNITQNYHGQDANIMFTSFDKQPNATAPVYVGETAYLNGTTAWYGVTLENYNDTLKEDFNATALEAQTVVPEHGFDLVLAGLPTSANTTIASSVGPYEGRQRVYISNQYTAPDDNSSKPIYQKWWFWFLIILVICAILAGVAYYVRNRKRHMYTPLEM